MQYKEQMGKLISKLSKGLYERDLILSQSLLSVISGQSVFLYGPPGTAKSLIARRISSAFENAKFFEYLMNRFSTPEDVFGPVSIKELKNDRYIRKTEGFLPTADVAFLDEIWKSSPAILNTLLTIINERKFSNGNEVEKVPLKGIVAASNEIPEDNQGLAALYDRFVMRLPVFPLQEREHFEEMLKNGDVADRIDVEKGLVLTDAEWKNILELSQAADISEEALNIIHAIRVKIDEYNQAKKDNGEKVYISDRRWQKMMQILKTAAILCDRDAVKPVDVLILKNCLWEKFEEKEDLAKMVEESVREFCPYHSEEYSQWDEKRKDLERDIEDTFFYNADVYESTDEIQGGKYFVHLLQKEYPELQQNHYDYRRNYHLVSKNIFIDFSRLKTKDDFHPVDENGNKIDYLTCNFNGKTACSITINLADSVYVDGHYYSGGYSKTLKATFKPRYKEGDCKPVTDKVRNLYKREVENLLGEYKEIAENVDSYNSSLIHENETPFVEDSDKAIVVASVKEFRAEMNSGKLDAEQLWEKIDKHVNPDV